MGITGLLPLLRPIQRRKHLSELFGLTIAVDGYVWLHRGAYTCAAEIVQKIPTRHYVDYCMSRVRTLKHYGINPYIVFDGGPLPAKLGTEKEREKKRVENIKRATELELMGKKMQARECFAKCLDVTPQMAYQFIKALKAENIPYVVAPYEADAQLAYLERTGIVDGILTEDSDLLVFGCQNVFFKLDTSSDSVISISRSDFGSPALAKDSLSLIGWTDTQFRWMAMLSGCDYLPSIQGIGLKTAHSLVKKHKTVEKVLQMLRLEGKRSIPKGYKEAFLLAEKVFLHQRVFDPRSKQLVYLNDPPENVTLSEEIENFIGQSLEQPIAQSIADGDLCPISLSKMEDINPTYSPKAHKPLPLQPKDTNAQGPVISAGAKEPPHKKPGLLNFFAPISKEPPTKSSSPVKQNPTKRPFKHAVAGSGSGKRTLVDVMDEDAETKRRKIIEEDKILSSKGTSRFFASAGPSEVIVLDSEEVEEPDGVNSLSTEDTEDLREEELSDPVEQEDGYLTPACSLSRDPTPELSSPAPALHRTLSAPKRLDTSSSANRDIIIQEVEQIFVRGSSEPAPEVAQEQRIPGPDLQKNFDNEDIDDNSDFDRLSCSSSEISNFWEEEKTIESPNTSASQDELVISSTKISKSTTWLEHDEEEVREEREKAVRASLAQKWRASYTFSISKTPRSKGAQQTNAKRIVTSKSSNNLTRNSSFKKSSIPPNRGSENARLKPRASDPVLRNSVFAPFNPRPRMGSREKPISIDSDEIEDDIVCTGRRNFDSFKFTG